MELEYVVSGAGEPVLLIHGAFLADAFAPLLAEPALTDRYRVISYHRRGFAGSAPAGGEASITRQAADARALLAHLGVQRAHVVGHSYGGCVALQLALDAPAVVHTLALLEPALLAVPAAERWFAEVGGPCIARYEAGDAAGAVATFLSGVFGPDVYADLVRTVPDGVEQAVADAGTFFQTDLPGIQEWRFGPEEARRVTQPVLGVLGADSDAVMVSPLFGEASRAAARAAAADGAVRAARRDARPAGDEPAWGGGGAGGLLRAPPDAVAGLTGAGGRPHDAAL